MFNMRAKVKPISECVQPTKRITAREKKSLILKVTRYFSFNRAAFFHFSFTQSCFTKICFFFFFIFLFFNSSFFFFFRPNSSLNFFLVTSSMSLFAVVNMSKVFVACLRNMCAQCDSIEIYRECVQHSQSHALPTRRLLLLFLLFFFFSFVFLGFFSFRLPMNEAKKEIKKAKAE